MSIKAKELRRKQIRDDLIILDKKISEYLDTRPSGYNPSNLMDKVSFDNAIEDLYAKKHELELEAVEISVQIASMATENLESPLIQRAETTYLNIIAVLLDVILGSGRLPAHPSIKNQSDLVQHIARFYTGFPGISESTLDHKFAAAKKSIERKDY